MRTEILLDVQDDWQERCAECGVEVSDTDATVVGWALARTGYRPRWTWRGQGQRLAEWWGRVVTLPTGEPVLELRNPAEGLPGRPRDVYTRYQYLTVDGVLKCRRLPAEGDVWLGEPAPPWWEPVAVRELHPPHLLLDWLLATQRIWGGSLATMLLHYPCLDYVVAWTPTGREVRAHPDGGVILQPPDDNWWHRCDDLDAARAWWYQHHRRRG